MALKTKVKVGNITNLSDARYCAGMGVDFLGFPIGGTHSIDPEKFKEITEWVSGPQFVAEWSGGETDNVAQIVSKYNVSFVEIDAAQLHLISDLGKVVIVTLAVDDWPKYKVALLRAKNNIGFVLLKLNESEVRISDVAQELSSHFSLLLDFNNHKLTVDEIMELPIKGISLLGSDELKPGLKDYSSLSAILEELEEMD